MQEVKVTVNGGIISDEELQEYIKKGRLQQPHNELVAITVTLDDDYVDIDYKYDNHLMPQRFSAPSVFSTSVIIFITSFPFCDSMKCSQL